MFVEGKKGPYGFDIAPGFWAMIDGLIEASRIACPAEVFAELRDGPADLTSWAGERRALGLFVESDAIAVQEAFKRVVAHVMRNYPDNPARRRFLDKADPWVIAHA